MDNNLAERVSLYLEAHPDVLAAVADAAAHGNIETPVRRCSISIPDRSSISGCHCFDLPG